MPPTVHPFVPYIALQPFSIAMAALPPRHFLALINPISGTGRKEQAVKYLQDQCAERQHPLQVWPTTANGNYLWLEDKIANEGITDVVIIGGDGTVNQVINALRHLPVQFGIVPFGSGNGVALAAGISKKSNEAIDNLFSGLGVPTDAFLLNGHFSCLLSGLGFDAQVAYEFANSGQRGFLSYAQQSIKQFFRAHPYQFEIETGGLSFFVEAYLISIANSNQFGNQVTIAPQASLSDGLLDIVIVQKMNKVRLPFAVLRQIRGNNRLQQLVDDIGREPILYFQAKELRIHNRKHAPLHIDGEPQETAHDIAIEIMPGCFTLIQPQTA